MEFVVGFLIFTGLMVVSSSIDKVAKRLAEGNALKEAELRAAGVELE